MKDIKVFIVLLNYNGYKDTLSCIDSIVELEETFNNNIVVVDNNSTDNSKEILEKDSRFHFIEANENGGFARGNNIGIKYALDNGAHFILLLNNDTVIEKNAITNMVKKMQEDSALGIVGSRIMYYDNKDIINYCGGKYNWLKATTIHENYKEKYIDEGTDYKDTEFVTGCSMLIKTEVFKKVGMLPEEYFMYYEDADYCMQVKEKGYKLGVCTNSVIYHKVSISSGGENSPFSIKWGNRNRLIFINKYKKYTKGLLTKLVFYTTRFILFIKYNKKGKKDKGQAIVEGVREGRRYLKENKE